MFKNPYFKNALSALAVAVLGFVLLNLAFILFALFTRAILLFLPADFAGTSRWFMPLMLIIFVFIIALVSWLIFKSGLGEIYKAVYLTMPSAVIFVAISILLYRQPAAAYGVNALVLGAIIVYLYETKKPWLYYYAVVLVATVLLITALLGVDI